MQPFNYFNQANRGQVNYADQYKQAKADEEKRQMENSPEAKRIKAFQLMNLENAERQQAMVTDAKQAKTLIANGDIQGAMNFLQGRAQLISELGGSARETMEVYNALRAGQPDMAMGMINNFLSVASGKDMEQAEKRFAPEVSPLQTDQETGQQYVVITDRDTGQPKRVDVKGGKALTQDERDARAVRVDLLKDAKLIGKEAFNDLKNVRSTISNYNEAIKAIDEGASSGAIDRFLPSFKESTIRLNNAAQRLGLNVISATTFGALSEGELRLAMDTAVPTNLEPKELRKWLSEKREAQKKLANELNRMATTLSKGKTTLGEYLESANYAEGDLIQDNQQSQDNDPLGLF